MSEKMLLVIQIDGQAFKGKAFMNPDGTFLGDGPLEKIKGVSIEFSQGVKETPFESLLADPPPTWKEFEKDGPPSWSGKLEK